MIESLTLTPLILAADLCAGVLLGAFFFGGLWWTIRSSPPSQWSGLVFSSSLRAPVKPARCSEWKFHTLKE